MADFDTATTDAPEAVTDAAPDAPVVDTVADAPEPSVSDIAASMGWSPRDKFTGDPAKWKPAGEYMRATADINRKLAKEQRELRQTVERMATTSAAIVEQQVAERVAAAEARFDAAVEAGDANAARAATRAIDSERAKLATARANDDPEAAFAAENPWYEKDEKATALAVGISQRMARQGKSVAEQLDEAAKAVRETYPHLFGDKPPIKAAPGVHAPSTRTAAPSNRAKGVADLPPSARKAAEGMVRSMKGMTLEAYAKEYWKEQAA